MGSAAQPLRPSLTLINHQTSTRFFKNLHLRPRTKKWYQNANSTSDHRFPFLSYSNSSSLHPPFSFCSRFSLSSPHLPSLFPLGFNHFRSFLTSMFTPQAAAAAAAADGSFQLPSKSKTVRVVIKGRVQGVFYRNWTIENATQLGLKGWVRNRRDGSVEALFSGTPDSVQEMEQRCRRGPPASMVTDLQVFPSDEDPGAGFQRKPTV